MVRRISGKYKAYNKDMSDVREICNTLAERFAFNSSSDNYSHRFNGYRLKLEKKCKTLVVTGQLYLLAVYVK